MWIKAEDEFSDFSDNGSDILQFILYKNQEKSRRLCSVKPFFAFSTGWMLIHIQIIGEIEKKRDGVYLTLSKTVGSDSTNCDKVKKVLDRWQKCT